MNNPYAAPSADLTQVRDDGQTYQPKVFAIQGRLGRLRYLAYGLAVTFSIVAAMGVLGVLLAMINPLLGVLVFLLYIPLLGVSFVMAKRRLNDMDQSGWLSLLMIIPLVNIVFGLWLVCGRGTAGSNRFGPAPCENSKAVVVTAWAMLAVAVAGGIATAMFMPAYSAYMDKALEKQAISVPAQ